MEVLKDTKSREKISFFQLTRRYNTEDQAQSYFEASRWANGRQCPFCNSSKTITASHKTMPYRCQKCKKLFSVRIGTLMESSKLRYRQWLMAIFLISTSLKGIASTKLASDIGVTQKTAWFLGHRIRTAQSHELKVLLGSASSGATGAKRLSSPYDRYKNSAVEYIKRVSGQKGVESFWTMLKRGLYGVHHYISLKHLQKYIGEFNERQSVRAEDTMVQLVILTEALGGKRLRYQELIEGVPVTDTS